MNEQQLHIPDPEPEPEPGVQPEEAEEGDSIKRYKQP